MHCRLWYLISYSNPSGTCPCYAQNNRIILMNDFMSFKWGDKQAYPTWITYPIHDLWSKLSRRMLLLELWRIHSLEGASKTTPKQPGHYNTPVSSNEGGVYWFHLVRPSVDRIVSALYHHQGSPDPFHIYTFDPPTSEGVSPVRLFWNTNNDVWQIL